MEKGIFPSVAGGERGILYLGLAQNVSRVECNAGRNFSLTNLLRWFNKIDSAGEPPFCGASPAALQSIYRWSSILTEVEVQGA